MIGHPVLLGAMGLDLCAMAAVIFSAGDAFRIATQWRPASSGPTQLLLEARAEIASIIGRAGFFLFAGATLTLLIALTMVMPALVPGAMCGTGVLQACHPWGTQTILYRVAAIAVFYLWVAVDNVNRRHPNAPITQATASLTLLLLPLSGLATASTWTTLAGMQSPQPVDCCMVVYDQFASQSAAATTGGLPNAGWAWIHGVITGLLVISGWAVHKRQRLVWMFTMTLGALAWAPVALVTLTRVSSPYLYGVLHHHCPWCFFTESGAWMGFPLLFAAAGLLLEAAAAPVVWWMAGRSAALGPAARVRVAQSGFRVAAWATVFAALAIAPALWWYWRFGVWITGGR